MTTKANPIALFIYLNLSKEMERGSSFSNNGTRDEVRGNLITFIGVESVQLFNRFPNPAFQI